MTPECSDVFQPIRMGLLWPIIVAGTAFVAIEIIATTYDGKWSRWQAILAGVAALAAGVVTTTIARHWSGNEVYWLSFTVGLLFMACVLLVHAIMRIVQADTDG